MENEDVGNLEISEIENLEFWKRRGQNNPEDPSNMFRKYWIWNQDLPENMKWIFVNMGSIFTKTKKNGCLNLCIFDFGTLKIWGFDNLRMKL